MTRAATVDSALTLVLDAIKAGCRQAQAFHAVAGHAILCALAALPGQAGFGASAPTVNMRFAAIEHSVIALKLHAPFGQANARKAILGSQTGQSVRTRRAHKSSAIEAGFMAVFDPILTVGRQAAATASADPAHAIFVDDTNFVRDAISTAGRAAVNIRLETVLLAVIATMGCTN